MTNQIKHIKQRLIICLALAAAMFAVPAGAAPERLFVVTTDYETGGYAVFKPGGTAVQKSVGTVFQDAVARSFGNRIYVVERWHGDNILVLDRSDVSEPVLQFSVGSGTNPHDFLLLSSTKAYVTLYERAEMLIVDPSAGRITGTIDLSGFADSDGIPEMDLMVRCHGRVFVSLQRLDRNALFQPSGRSCIAVIDPEADTVIDAQPDQPGVQGIDLSFTNPVDMQYVGAADALIVAGAGSFYSAGDGGLERVDPEALSSDGTVMTEQELGGQLGGALGTLSMVGDTEGYAIVMTEDWAASQVVRFNLRDRSAKTIHAPGNGFVHADVRVHGGRLYICDRSMRSPGVRVFDTATDREITEEPIDTGLPPFCLVRAGGEPASASDAADSDNQTGPGAGGRYLTALVSPSPLPLYTDVLLFNDDGSFAMKKLSVHGSGEYYTLGKHMFYFVFTGGAAADIQFLQGAGVFLSGPQRNMIAGCGTLMIDYSSLPFVFTGVEVFQ